MDSMKNKLRDISIGLAISLTTSQFSYSLGKDVAEFPPRTLPYHLLIDLFDAKIKTSSWVLEDSSIERYLLSGETAEKIYYQGLYFSHKMSAYAATKVQEFLTKNQEAVARFTGESFDSPNGGTLGRSYTTQISKYALYSGVKSDDNIFKKFDVSVSKKNIPDEKNTLMAVSSIFNTSPLATSLPEIKMVAPPRPPRPLKPLGVKKIATKKDG